MNVIREPGRDVPIVREADVVVVGGGTAGIAAGVAAARNGADTIVIERYNCLGGQMTAGYVIFIPGAWEYDVSSPTFGGIMTEITQRLKDEDAFWRLDGTPKGHWWLDPEVMKWLGIDLLETAGAHIRLHSWVSNVIMEERRIKAIVVDSKTGRHAITAKCFIDASGDADLFLFAGAAFDKGTMRISLEGRVFLPDPEAYFNFTKKEGEAFPIWLKENGISSSFGWRMHRRVAQIRLAGCSWSEDSALAACLDGLEVETLTKIEIESRKEFKKMIDFYRDNVPGCRDMIMIETSSQLGVRESRRAIGDHILTESELDERVTFDDCIGRSGSPDTYYEIPYRSIYSRDVDNLWVAGRCISADHEAQSPIRIIPPCVLTGEAAGTAAAIAAAGDIPSAREVDAGELVDKLMKQGVALRDQMARLP